MKINCIIQARLGSTRLPGKVMMDIAGKLMVERVWERCLGASVVDEAIVAIPHADRVEMWLPPANFCGALEPAVRFMQVLKEYPCDGFVRVCADSPLIEPEIIDEAAQKIREGLDYYHAGWIWGNQAEGFNTKAFLEAEPSMRDDEREHLGLWFRRKTRLTVDDEGDLERVRWLISQQQ